MDTEWMRAKLKEYLAISADYDSAYKAAGYQWSPEAKIYYDNATMALPTVTQILKALKAMPDEALQPPSFGGSGDTSQAVLQGLGILHDQEEWAVRLAPQTPTFAADQFHPWVWQAAAPFWDAGQSAAAVEHGAKSLTARIQQKSGSRLADRALVADVFSPNSRDKSTRLWLPGERDTDTWKSRQEGLHYLAMGAYAGIRNVVAHSVEPGWSEQEALEYLAVLSTVARWADETKVMTITE